jgi:hypothetical protein
MKAVAVLVIAAFLLAGCSSDKPKGSDVPTTTGTPTATQSLSATSSSTSPSSSPPVDPFPRQIAFTDCRGVAARFIWPGDSAPAGPEVPPGWETQEMVATDHHVQVVECQRIAIGPFERGPLHFLLEAHDKATIPQACIDFRGADIGDFRILRSLWVDDEEIVQFLKDTMGIPALYGTFSFTETPAGAPQGMLWNWGLPGQDTSSLAYSRVDTIPGGGTGLNRIAWHTSGAVNLLDLAEDEQRPAASTLNAVAKLHPPMMHAVPEAEAYTGVYSLVDHGDYTADIYRFGDLQCEQPLP